VVCQVPMLNPPSQLPTGASRLHHWSAVLLVFLCAGCASISDLCRLRATGYVTHAAVQAGYPPITLAHVIGDAVRPFGFVYVEHTHDAIKWFTLGTAWSAERIDVFFNSDTGWISLKDYNRGNASELDDKLLAAIKAEISKNYHEQVQFKFQHDCLG
jgi:hypothetical protein